MEEDPFELYLRREGMGGRPRRRRKELRTAEARALRLEILDARRRPGDGARERRARVAAVLLDVLAGKTKADIARDHALSIRTVSRWLASWRSEGEAPP
jgi:hypothetical protein